MIFLNEVLREDVKMLQLDEWFITSIVRVNNLFRCQINCEVEFLDYKQRESILFDEY